MADDDPIPYQQIKRLSLAGDFRQGHAPLSGSAAALLAVRRYADRQAEDLARRMLNNPSQLERGPQRPLATPIASSSLRRRP